MLKWFTNISWSEMDGTERAKASYKLSLKKNEKKNPQQQQQQQQNK